MGNAQTMVKPDKVTLSFKSIIIEGVDGIPPLPPQPFLAKEVIAVAAPEDGPSTPIIAGEQQVTSTRIYRIPCWLATTIQIEIPFLLI